MKRKIQIDSDAGILAAIRADDPTGWEQFFNRFNSTIQAVICWPRWNFDQHEKQDVRQNIYLNLHQSLPSFRGESSLRWFVIQIAHRQCINEIRTQVRARRHTAPADSASALNGWNPNDFPHTLDPYQEISRNEQHQAILNELNRLQDRCRIAISLYYIENMSYRAMSQKLGIAVNTVGSRLSKCLDKLHKEIQKSPFFRKDQ